MSTYGGDITSSEAWSFLTETTAARVIDVRTRAEWTFVGVPDLSALGREVLLVEWQSFPEMTIDPAFAQRVSDRLTQDGVMADAPLLFLCRSGGRSRAAAIAMTEAGYSACFNIADGFEGNLDQARHRGGIDGWKAAGLPWMQS